MIIHNMEQGSPEWHEIRKGKLTGSHATAIANNGAGLKTYIKDIVIDMFIEVDHFKNDIMRRGNELEPIARLKYEFENRVEVEEIGFIEYSERCGVSLDGIVGDSGTIEIKSRDNKKHYDLLDKEKIDSGTIWQIQMGLFVSEREWCDFISYNPNFRKNSLFVKRVYRDDVALKKIEQGIKDGTHLIEVELCKKFVQQELL